MASDTQSNTLELFFKMHPAASADQSFLRNFGERGQVTNLDRLRSGRHRQKAIASLGQIV
jgi:hypothetical protein